LLLSVSGNRVELDELAALTEGHLPTVPLAIITALKKTSPLKVDVPSKILFPVAILLLGK
jgi:hypothetical protein